MRGERGVKKTDKQREIRLLFLGTCPGIFIDTGEGCTLMHAHTTPLNSLFLQICALNAFRFPKGPKQKKTVPTWTQCARFKLHSNARF